MTNEQVALIAKAVEEGIKPYIKELVAHEMAHLPVLVSSHINTLARASVRDSIQNIISQIVTVKVEVKGEELAECKAALLDYAAENKRLQALADRQEERIMELVRHYEGRMKA